MMNLKAWNEECPKEPDQEINLQTGKELLEDRWTYGPSSGR